MCRWANTWIKSKKGIVYIIPQTREYRTREGCWRVQEKSKQSIGNIRASQWGSRPPASLGLDLKLNLAATTTSFLPRPLKIRQQEKRARRRCFFFFYFFFPPSFSASKNIWKEKWSLLHLFQHEWCDSAVSFETCFTSVFNYSRLAGIPQTTPRQNPGGFTIEIMAWKVCNTYWWIYKKRERRKVCFERKQNAKWIQSWLLLDPSVSSELLDSRRCWMARFEPGTLLRMDGS